jgi:hypothetical protein
MKYILLTAALLTIYGFLKKRIAPIASKRVNTKKLATGIVLSITFFLIMATYSHISWGAAEAIETGRIGKNALGLALLCITMPAVYLAYRAILLVNALQNKK